MFLQGGKWKIQNLWKFYKIPIEQKIYFLDLIIKNLRAYFISENNYQFF